MGNYTKRYTSQEKEVIFNNMLDMLFDMNMSIRQLSKRINVSKSYIHVLLHTNDFQSYVRKETGIEYSKIKDIIESNMKQKKHNGQIEGGKSTAELWRKRKEINKNENHK